MVGRGMAVNAEEIVAGSSFPSSQRWRAGVEGKKRKKEKLLYPETRDWLIILGEEGHFSASFLT